MENKAVRVLKRTPFKYRLTNWWIEYKYIVWYVGETTTTRVY